MLGAASVGQCRSSLWESRSSEQRARRTAREEHASEEAEGVSRHARSVWTRQQSNRAAACDHPSVEGVNKMHKPDGCNLQGLARLRRHTHGLCTHDGAHSKERNATFLVCARDVQGG